MEVKPNQPSSMGVKETLDAPLFHFLLRPVLSSTGQALDRIFRVRWTLTRPLRSFLLPKCFPVVPVRCLRMLTYITLGELLLTIPVIALLAVGILFSFASHDLETSGEVASYSLLLTFLTANKTNSVAAFFLGIPFQRMIPFHRLSALTTVFLSCLHVYVAFRHGEDSSDSSDTSPDASFSESSSESQSDSQDRRMLSGDSEHAWFGTDPDFIQFAFDGNTNISGSLLVLSLIGLVFLSFFSILRRHFFNTWLFAHVILALAAIVFCFLHDLVVIPAVVGIWWGVDIFVRYVLMTGCRYPTTATVRVLTSNEKEEGGDLVQVDITKPRGFEYNPGQFVQLAIPGVSRLEFHPFSISSAPHESTLTLHFRILGDWTKKVASFANENKGEVKVWLEGPYGSLMVDLNDEDRHPHILCVSGGIGVTHCLSVAKWVHHKQAQQDRPRKLQFVWAVPDDKLVRTMANAFETSVPSAAAKSNTETSLEAHPDVATKTDAKSVDNSSDHENTTAIPADVYVTRVKEPKGSNPLAANFNMLEGRPDFDVILSQMKEEAVKEGITRVAVFGCGPPGLVDDLREVCRQQGDGYCGRKFAFDFHEEYFAF